MRTHLAAGTKGLLNSVVRRLAHRRGGSSASTLNVVLPQAPGFNVGMAAVDLGLIALSQALSLEIVPWRVKALHDRARSADPSIDHRMDVGLGGARMIEESWPDGLDGPIVYWGDFHHMAQYVNAVGAAIGGESGVALARRYLLLDGVAPDVVSRSATFGTTLIFNSAADFLDPDYGRALTTFLRENHASWFRDPISSSMAARLRGRDGVALGVDPAMFAGPMLSSASRGSRGVGVFLGRNRESHTGLLRIAHRLAESIGEPLEWIDWGDPRGFPNLGLPEGMTTPRVVGSTTAMEALIDLASCAVLVTDSYHAALIAWRLGTPAITVAAPASTRPRSVDSGARWSWRDKRELAGSLYGALDYVVRIEEMKSDDGFDSRVAHIVDTVASGAVSGFVRSQIEADARAAMSSFGRVAAHLTGAR